MSIALMIWEQGLHQFNFFGVLGDVRLNWEIGFFLQGAEAVHQFAGTAGCETGRDDGCDEGVRRVDAGDVGDCCAGVGEACGGRDVTVEVWGERVHAAAADEGSLAILETEVC
jgi:hypothetical protein